MMNNICSNSRKELQRKSDCYIISLFWLYCFQKNRRTNNKICARSHTPGMLNNLQPMQNLSITLFIFHQPSSVRGWTSAFLLTVDRLCGVIEGRLSHFLPRWLRTGWQSVISQWKIPWNTPPWLEIEPGPQGGGERPVSYPTELSWLIYLLVENKYRSYFQTSKHCSCALGFWLKKD